MYVCIYVKCKNENMIMKMHENVNELKGMKKKLKAKKPLTNSIFII